MPHCQLCNHFRKISSCWTISCKRNCTTSAANPFATYFFETDFTPVATTSSFLQRHSIGWLSHSTCSSSRATSATTTATGALSLFNDHLSELAWYNFVRMILPIHNNWSWYMHNVATTFCMAQTTSGRKWIETWVMQFIRCLDTWWSSLLLTGLVNRVGHQCETTFF